MYKRSNLPFITIFIAAVLLFFLVGPALSATKMPAFNLENAVTGKKTSSAIFKGKSLLVIFFATWCPPCMQEIPSLIDLQDKYKAKGFSVLGLSVDTEGKKVIQRLVKKQKINYPIMMADNDITRDFGGVYGIPTSFLVNSRGTVVKRYTGYVPHSVLAKDIEQVIK